MVTLRNNKRTGDDSVVSREQTLTHQLFGNVDDVVVPSDDHIRQALHTLRQSSSAYETLLNSTELFKLFMPETKNYDYQRELSEKMTRLNAVTICLFAIQRWPHSQILDITIRLICLIAYNDKNARNFIIESGGIRALLVIAGSCEHFVRNSVIRLLLILSTLDSIKNTKEVATEECITFVVDTMMLWPHHMNIQENCCGYLDQVGQIEEVMERLRRRQVGILLMRSLENFRDNEDVRENALSALYLYMSSE